MAGTCPKCHKQYRGDGLCQECSVERAYGTPEIPDSAKRDGWAEQIEQEALGDNTVAGQTTLDGGVVGGDE